MLYLFYVCPETMEPIGRSIVVERIEEAPELVLIEECPLCGNEHELTRDDLFADPEQ